MSDIMTKAQILSEKCEEVQRALEETDGAARPYGSSFKSVFDEIPNWFRPFSDLPNWEGLRSQGDDLIQTACKSINLEWGAPEGYSSGTANSNPELGTALSTTRSLLGMPLDGRIVENGWTGQAATLFHLN